MLQIFKLTNEVKSSWMIPRKREDGSSCRETTSQLFNRDYYVDSFSMNEARLRRADSLGDNKKSGVRFLRNNPTLKPSATQNKVKTSQLE